MLGWGDIDCDFDASHSHPTSQMSLHSQFSHKPILTKYSLWEPEALSDAGLGCRRYQFLHLAPCLPCRLQSNIRASHTQPIFLWSCSCHWLPFCWHPEGLPATQTADGQEKRAGAHIAQRKKTNAMGRPCGRRGVWLTHGFFLLGDALCQLGWSLCGQRGL